MKHELKILPEYYRAVVERRKAFEVRKNDRPFAVGDSICLREFDPQSKYGYTGRIWYGHIKYILNNPLYCKKGFVIMSIEEDNTYFA